MTMFFDRNRNALVSSPDGLDALARWMKAEEQTPPDPQWFDAGIFCTNPSPVDEAGADQQAGPELEPTVAGIVELLTRPTRSVVLERFAGGLGEVSFVNWDAKGRVAITEGASEELATITATDLTLLPGRMVQAVGLRPGRPASTRPALTTTTEVMEALLEAGPADGAEGNELALGTDGGGDDLNHQHLMAVLGAFERGWRASGAWRGQSVDDSLTVLSAGPEGLWLVESDAAEAGSGSTLGPDTTIRLTPASPAEVSRRLGDVVSGRAGRQPAARATAGVPAQATVGTTAKPAATAGMGIANHSNMYLQ